MLGDGTAHEETSNITEETRQHSADGESVREGDPLHDAASNIHRSEVEHFGFIATRKS